MKVTIAVLDTETEISLMLEGNVEDLLWEGLRAPLSLAESAHCYTLSQTVHGTHNTLWMCKEMERNMEQKRHFTYNVICSAFA